MFPEIARALAPGGCLLIGFVEGIKAEPSAHGITTAYYWPIEQMQHTLRESGSDVLDVETHQDSGKRPHAAIAAIVR